MTTSPSGRLRCVGGHADGEWHYLKEGYPVLALAEMPEFSITAIPEAVPTKVDLKVAEFTFLRWRKFLTQKLYIC